MDEIILLNHPKIKEMTKKALRSKVKEIDRQIKFITELPQQYTLSRYIVKYLNELRIEVLGELERRDNKPVTNSIHVEKMWAWTLKHHCYDIRKVMIYGYEQFYFCKYLMIKGIIDNMGILWDSVYIPEKTRRNIQF